jgi:hypothetical protein
MVLVWSAVFMLVMVGILGLSLDWAKIRFNEHELHNAADAAALAGAQFVKFPGGQPRARATAIALAAGNNAESLSVSVADNPDNAPTGEVIIGRWIQQRREFNPTTDGPNAMRVVGRRMGERDDAPVFHLIWGPAFKSTSAHRWRYATAMSQGSSGAGYLAILLNPPEKTGILVGGGSVIHVNGGDIQDNSQSLGNPREAFRASGSFTVDCQELNVCGDVYPPADDAYWQSVDYSVNPNTRVPLPDPLVNVPDMWSSPPQRARPAVIAPPPPDTAYPAPRAMATYYYGLYGMAVKVDPSTGQPLLDSNQHYIQTLDSNNKPFDASLAEPIVGSTVTTYGQVVSCCRASMRSEEARRMATTRAWL